MAIFRRCLEIAGKAENGKNLLGQSRKTYYFKLTQYFVALRRRYIIIYYTYIHYTHITHIYINKVDFAWVSGGEGPVLQSLSALGLNASSSTNRAMHDFVTKLALLSKMLGSV